MTFLWNDRTGQPHDLDSPALIDAEAKAISQDIDRFMAVLESPDRTIRDTARNVIDAHKPRLEQLHADTVRWDAHATAMTRAAAAEFVGEIERLPAMLRDLMLVVALHREHDDMLDMTAGAPNTRATILAEPTTSIQRRAIVACASRTAPPDTATRAEAQAWLDRQPHFARRSHADDGWFAWTDRGGHAHRLIDPLPIEREVATIAKELADLRPTLAGDGDVVELFTKLESGLASWRRLEILQGDLERFEREEDARDLAACKAYAADWRSKRTT